MRKYFIALLMALTMIGFGGVSIAAPTNDSDSKGGVAANGPDEDESAQAGEKGAKGAKGEKGDKGDKGDACPEPTNRNPESPTPGCGQCPEGQEKVKGQCSAPPCPDRDGDGVCDDVDECPDEAGTQPNGCPPPPPPPTFDCGAGFADGTAVPVLGASGTVLNKDKNETGTISKPIHENLEPRDPTGSLLTPPGEGVVHEANCTVVITVEELP